MLFVTKDEIELAPGITGFRIQAFLTPLFLLYFFLYLILFSFSLGCSLWTFKLDLTC